MHADYFLVIGPECHQGIEIRPVHRVVESGLHFFGAADLVLAYHGGSGRSGILVVAHFGARFQAVGSTAVRAFGFAVLEVEEDARMGGPQRHGRIRAVCRQVFAIEFDWGLGVAHLLMLREREKHDFNAFAQQEEFAGKMSVDSFCAASEAFHCVAY
jgi:hypothetical protein